jgi:hypothetical protein
MIWYEDLSQFLGPNTYFIIAPSNDMTLEEKLNAIVRFFLYLGVFLAIFHRDSRYLFFGIIAGGVSIVLYNHEQKLKAQAERFLEKKDLDIVDNKVCVRSTVENPFMNPSVYDIGASPDRPPACASAEHPRIQTAIEDNFTARLFRDVGDLYGKNASQREFYTVPNTTIPNNQTGFAEWLYGKGASCKENNGDQCVDNIEFTRTRHRMA